VSNGNSRNAVAFLIFYPRENKKSKELDNSFVFSIIQKAGLKTKNRPENSIFDKKP